MSEESKRKDRPGDQPMPVPNDGPSMHDLVCADLESEHGHRYSARLLADEVKARKQLGLSRYGSLLQAFNARDAVQDALDESVDLLVYLRQGMVEEAAAGEEGLRAQLATAYHDAIQVSLTLAWVRSVKRGRHEH